jgi:hypothetical protein
MSYMALVASLVVDPILSIKLMSLLLFLKRPQVSNLNPDFSFILVDASKHCIVIICSFYLDIVCYIDRRTKSFRSDTKTTTYVLATWSARSVLV